MKVAQGYTTDCLKCIQSNLPINKNPDVRIHSSGRERRSDGSATGEGTAWSATFVIDGPRSLRTSIAALNTQNFRARHRHSFSQVRTFAH